MKYVDPMKDTPEGQLLGIVHELEKAVEKKYANMGCDDDADAGYKSDRGEGPTPELPFPKGGENLKPKKGKKGKKDKKGKKAKKGDDEIGKTDATSEFLRERGIIVKYESENSVDNQVPQLMEVSGSETIRATTYTTNQRVPFMGEGNSRSPISEVYKMPSVSQTGYDKDSSSLHMHLTDGGGFTDNRAKVEETLATLKKAYPGKTGIIEEIASQVERIYARL